MRISGSEIRYREIFTIFFEKKQNRKNTVIQVRFEKSDDTVFCLTFSLMMYIMKARLNKIIENCEAFMKTRRVLFIVLFAALIASAAFFGIPIGPVPIVFQNGIAILSGLLLGPVSGFFAVVLFLLAGILGMPVFSGGTAGLAVLAGPTGGYLIGYALGAFAAGFLFEKLPLPKIASAIIAAFAGFAFIYVPGLFRLAQTLHLSLNDTFAKGLVPFLLADFLKAVVIIIVALRVKDKLNRFLS